VTPPAFIRSTTKGVACPHWHLDPIMEAVAAPHLAGPEHHRFADPAIVATYGLDVATRRVLSYDVVSRKTGGRARKRYEKAQ
jgi:hypothetical protein